jgi:RimJ/RimL family protein N-acetyltransferase
MTGELFLRDVTAGDLAVFFEHQLDDEATRMAAFPARDRDTFMAHWERILADDTCTTHTIDLDGHVAGNIGSWLDDDGQRLVGYWIGREFWGKGVATRALAELLRVVRERPLYAHVAEHNAASIRVLDKCGFVVTGHDAGEVVMSLR